MRTDLLDAHGLHSPERLEKRRRLLNEVCGWIGLLFFRTWLLR